MPRLRRRTIRRKGTKGSSKIEDRITKLLAGTKFKLAGREYDCLYTNELGEKCILEIDGDYHHKKYLRDMNLMQMQNYCNDRFKNDVVKTTDFIFHRVHTTKLRKKRKITKDWLDSNQYFTQLEMDKNAPLFHKKAIPSVYASPVNSAVIVTKFLALCIPNYNKALFEKNFMHILKNKIPIVLTYNNIINFKG